MTSFNFSIGLPASHILCIWTLPEAELRQYINDFAVQTQMKKSDTIEEITTRIFEKQETQSRLLVKTTQTFRIVVNFVEIL